VVKSIKLKDVWIICPRLKKVKHRNGKRAFLVFIPRKKFKKNSKVRFKIVEKNKEGRILKKVPKPIYRISWRRYFICQSCGAKFTPNQVNYNPFGGMR